MKKTKPKQKQHQQQRHQGRQPTVVPVHRQVVHAIVPKPVQPTKKTLGLMMNWWGATAVQPLRKLRAAETLLAQYRKIHAKRSVKELEVEAFPRNMLMCCSWGGDGLRRMTRVFAGHGGRGYIRPTGGIRQGGTLSPSLFVLLTSIVRRTRHKELPNCKMFLYADKSSMRPPHWSSKP